MIQKSCQEFSSACGKAKIIVENDMPIGVFHDFLMEIKGNMVEKMVAVHKEEVAVTEEQKKQEEAPACCQGECA